MNESDLKKVAAFERGVDEARSILTDAATALWELKHDLLTQNGWRGHFVKDSARERVYTKPAGSEDAPFHGVILYTQEEAWKLLLRRTRAQLRKKAKKS